MLKIWLVSWFLLVPVCSYTFYERKTRPELFQDNAELNPQGLAFHNINDMSPYINKPSQSDQSNDVIAMLPSLLMTNPRAKGVFDNLSFFANPQFLPDTMRRQRSEVIDFDQEKRTIRRKPTINTLSRASTPTIVTPSRNTISGNTISGNTIVTASRNTISRTKKREILNANQEDKIHMGLIRILRKAIMDFQRKRM